MIKILDASYQRLGVIKNIINASHREELNGEFTLDFEAILDPYLQNLLSSNSYFEVYGQYFILGFIQNGINSDGQTTTRIEADHISYLLNNKEYDLEPWDEETQTGFRPMINATPSDILTELLMGTSFIGSINVSITNLDYQISSTITRRQAIIDLMDMVKGEIIWNNFNVSIVSHRGSTVDKVAIIGKNVTSLSFEIDKRTRIEDETKPYLLTYNCEIIENIEDEVYNLGDDVRIIDRNLGIDTIQRVISIVANPNNENEPRIITLGDLIHRDLSTSIGEIAESGNEFQEGPKGEKGDKGDQGDPGPKGDKGDEADPDPTWLSTISNATGSQQVIADVSDIKIKSAGNDYSLQLSSLAANNTVLQHNGGNLTLQNVKKIVKLDQSSSLIERSSITCEDTTIRLKISNDEYLLDLSNGTDGNMLVKDGDTIKFDKASGSTQANYNIWIGTALPPIADGKIDTLYIIYE